MKNLILNLMAVLLLATCWLPAAAQTEAVSGRVVTNIPFDFIVGEQVMPAGNYVIESSGVQDTLLVRNLTNPSKHTFITVTDLNTNDGNANTRLIFRTVGEQRVLAEVWAKGLDHGHRLSYPGKIEEAAPSTTVAATKK